MSELELVTQQLKNQSIAFEVIEADETGIVDDTNLGIMAQGVLLQDALTPIMAFLPMDSILHIDKLAESVKSNFMPMPKNLIEAKFPMQTPLRLPPIANFFNARVIAEKSLKMADTVCFSIERGDYIIRLAQTEFEKLVPESSWLSFAFNPALHAMQSLEQKSQAKQDFFKVENFTLETLKAHVEQMQELPVMSQTAQDILRLQSDPNAEVDDLAIIVEQSPSLAAQVIKWANSPYYGYPGGVRTVQDAIIKVLGFDLVMNLALGLALGDKFKIPEDGPIGLNHYWQHALYTAALEERLVKIMPPRRRPMVGLAYLTGLLHNFGYLLMGQLFKKHFDMINRLIPFNPHLSNVQIEESVLGVAHTELGSWLMAHWCMPNEVVYCNRDHHKRIEYYEQDEVYITLVNTATIILKYFGMGDGTSHLIPEENLNFLKIAEYDLDEMLEQFEEDTDGLNEIANQIVKAATT